MKPVFTYLLLFAFFVLNAQVKTDSIYTLPEVVKASHSSTRVVTLSSPFSVYKYLAGKSLNEALRENAGIYFKNYGNGQLSSVTIRGTSAAQTDLLWNGIKLNSPSLGQVDVSLFNISMSDQVELAGISYSGNVGGYIDFQNKAFTDSGVSLNAMISYGSFNTVRASGVAKYGNGRFSGTTRLSYLSSDNNYPFIDSYTAGNPVEKLSNARVQLLNCMQQFYAKVNTQNSVQFNLWLSDAQRQIPPIISKPTSSESQDDYSLRSALSWNGNYGPLTVKYTTAFLHDVIHYRNPEIATDEKSVMQAFRNNLAITYDSLKKFSVFAEAGYDLERAVVPSYGGVKSRSIEKLVVGVMYDAAKDILLQAHLRESVYGKVLSPFSPILSARYFKYYPTRHFWMILANVSRNFRFPTLNDLYWVPGGNPNLKTEKSWDSELSGKYGYRDYFTFKATGFCKYIDNWIQWTPDGSYWQPHNVKRVLTRGIEMSAKADELLSGIVSDFNLAFNANYTYTRATNLDAITPADQSKGKQLIYVPLHVASLGAYFEYKRFYLRAINTYTGAVFITTDNTQALKGYYLLDLEVGKDFAIRNYEIGASFRVNNITDRRYQTVAQRPMPGRNFEGTLRFKFS